MSANSETVRLRRLWWDGPEPRCGDALITRTGRKYLITAIRGKTLECLRLRSGKGLLGRIFRWRWGGRK